MRIGVPRDDGGERRVPLIPEMVASLVGDGHEVVVESGAGKRAGYPDEAYATAGAVVAGSVSDTELVLTISPPEPAVVAGRTVLGFLRPFDRPEAMSGLAAAGVTSFAFEAIPRTTRAQTVDALSSQATAAGYSAALLAAAESDRFFPMLTTAAGTIRPASVVVLGAGVAGLQAIATARRLGAVVSGFDVRAEAAEQIRSVGATPIGPVPDEAGEGAEEGGYVRAVSETKQSAIRALLAPHIAGADVVITTASIPGRPAPLLVTTPMVEAMRPGAVVVDLSAATGGNCELTEPGEVVEWSGVRILGHTDLASRVAHDASRLLSRNVSAFIHLLVGDGGELAPHWDDDIVAQACVTRDGVVVHPWVVAS